MSHLCKPKFEFSGNTITAPEKLHKLTFFQGTLLVGPALLPYCGMMNPFKIQWLKLITFYYHEAMS